MLQFASYSFDASLEQTLPGLTAGARIVIRPDQMWTTEELCEQIRTHGITVMELVPTYWAEFAASLDHTSAQALATLRLVITGGEVLPPAPTAPGSPTSPRSRWSTPTAPPKPPSPPPPTPSRAHRRAHPDRYGAGGRRTYILDPRYPTPSASGELCIGGPELARGYHHRPALTADRFPRPPRTRRQPHLPTATAPPNPRRHLHYLGRLDNQIKLRGYRIELDEIQTTLTNHPHITTAITTIREDQPGHPASPPTTPPPHPLTTPNSAPGAPPPSPTT
ncbi:amino acid adenylation domain-containing protein [Streptacidiphilus sp. 4-A2]|nr:amino acid adenylation domain-containing protein [Streptacidiphilus sp. 4-A2]